MTLRLAIMEEEEAAAWEERTESKCESRYRDQIAHRHKEGALAPEYLVVGSRRPRRSRCAGGRDRQCNEKESSREYNESRAHVVESEFMSGCEDCRQAQGHPRLGRAARLHLPLAPTSQSIINVKATTVGSQTWLAKLSYQYHIRWSVENL